jgi:hypothetical protein
MKRAFFAVYAVVLFVHVAHQLPSLPIVVALSTLAGVALSISAHKAGGLLALLLIGIHIAMETHEHTLHWHTYSGTTIAFTILHTTLDGVFLWLVTKEVFPRRGRLVFTAAGTVWLAGACVSWQESPRLSFAEAPQHDHAPDPGLGFLYGGMLGCALVHARKDRSKTGL